MVTACGGTEGATTSAAPIPPETTAAAPQPAASFDVQGHRGARGLQPENTLPAFETALDLGGVTTLELDLHFTADGQVVVWHDPVVSDDKCERSQGGEDIVEPAIASLTREELRMYQCGKNPDPGRFPDQQATATELAGRDHTIVTLGELFEFVAAYANSGRKSAEQRANADRVLFNVETKRVPDRPETINDGFDGVNPGPFETAILDEIAAHGLADRVTIQSFDHRSLRAIRSVDDTISLAALTRRNEPFDPGYAEFAQIWSPDYRSISADSLNEAHAAGMLVIPWTVNETRDMTRLIGLGVDGIITDRPDLLIEQLAG